MRIRNVSNKLELEREVEEEEGERDKREKEKERGIEVHGGCLALT